MRAGSPGDPKKNTAAVAVISFLEKIGNPFGVEITLEKRMPLSSGLGSSAASAVAAVTAVNILAGRPLAPRDLLPFTMEAERVACGSAHADNVAPSLLGGFVLIRSYEPLDVVQLPVPRGLSCAVVHPHAELRTEDARRVAEEGDPALGRDPPVGEPRCPRRRAVQRRSPAPRQVAAGCHRRAGPFPAHPWFRSGEGGAVAAGALGMVHLGVRPLGFRAVLNAGGLGTRGAAMTSAFKAAGLGSDLYLSAVNTKGPVEISE